MIIDKDHKKICVSDPRLVKVRDEFRKLWYAAYDEKGYELLEKRSQARLEDEKWSQIHRELRGLDEDMERSTLKCSECGTFSGDRIYIAKDDRWFCIKCYNGPYVPWPDIGND